MKKRIAIILLTTMLLQGSASALQLNTTEFDRDSMTVTVSGKVDMPNTRLTIQVLKPGMKWTDITDENPTLGSFAYLGQPKVNGLGDFSAAFQINGASGLYPVRVYSDGDKEFVYDDTLYVFSRQTIDEMIEKIATEKDAAELERLLTDENTLDMLGLDMSEVIALDSAVRAQLFKNFIAERVEQAIKSVTDIQNAIKRAHLLVRINDATSTTLSALIDENPEVLGLDDESSYNLYINETFYEPSRKAALLTKLSARSNYGTISEFKKKFDEQTLLYACYNRENYHTIGDIFEDSVLFKNLDTGNYNKLTSKTDVYKEVNKLISPAKSLEELAKLVRDASGSKSGSSTGSGSSGSSGRGSTSSGRNTLVPSLKEEGNVTAEQPPVAGSFAEAEFTDMDGYEWAREAINGLRTAGIISGRGDNTFGPGDSITREEFLKMLVNILGGSASAAPSNFLDVNPDAWYAGVVATGVELEITKGISETEFGVGRAISREEMTTMVYNALTDSLEVVDGTAEFVDFDRIADYAREAVTMLYANGFVKGIGDGVFAPEQEVDRASAAQLIYRIYRWRNDNV